MNVHVRMPQMGESVAEGTIVRWLKKTGDSIQRDEAILEISTDKVDTEVPAPVGGVVGRLLAAEGATLPVGTPLAEIETDEIVSEPTPEPKQEESAHFRASAHETTTFSRPAAVAPTTSLSLAPQARAASVRRNYSPSVMRAALAANLNLQDLEAIPGTAFHGRLTPADVEKYAATHPRIRTDQTAEKPAWLKAPVEDSDRIVEMSSVRKRIAEHMIWSRRISAHATAFADLDVSSIVALKRPGISYLTFFSLAIVELLRKYPLFNACVLDDNRILLKGRTHLSIAVAVEDDLFVPVIRNADELNFAGMAKAIKELTDKARAGKLTPDDLRGGTFTITNPGTFGGVSGTPIINQPQVAILGLGAITKKAVVVNDAICIRPMMSLSLSFDHRIIDGAAGFKFLEALRARLHSFTA